MKKKIIIRVLSALLIVSALVLNVNSIVDNASNDLTASQLINNANAVLPPQYEDIWYPIVGGWTICCEEDTSGDCWRWAWPNCPN